MSSHQVLSVPSTPAVTFQGETWPSERMAALAGQWREAVAPQVRDGGLVAQVITNRPEAAALFLALSTLPVHVVLLQPDPRAWRSAPPVPPGTPVALLPAQHGLAAPAGTEGLAPLLLPVQGPGAAPLPGLFACRGVIAFTSGSTGAPKPVCRNMAALLGGARADLEGFGLRPGDGIIATVPLSTFNGLVRGLVYATLLGSSLGLVDRGDPRATLALFATGRYRYWNAIPFTVDAVTRLRLDGPAPRAPELCIVGGAVLSRALAQAFQRRFDVMPRTFYGTSEGGGIAGVQDEDIPPHCVGRPMPGVELAIGDDPLHPLGVGEAGSVWFRSHWYMDGYGFPPTVEPPPSTDGWRLTGDLGRLDTSGRLTLLGRLDARFKTPAGRLINPGHVAAVAANCPGVLEAEVVPLPRPGGAAIGLVAVGDGLTADALRAHAGRVLPSWSWPEVVRVVPALPRLPGGKVDRAACAALLTGAPGEPATGGRA